MIEKGFLIGMIQKEFGDNPDEKLRINTYVTDENLKLAKTIEKLNAELPEKFDYETFYKTVHSFFDKKAQELINFHDSLSCEQQAENFDKYIRRCLEIGSAYLSLLNKKFKTKLLSKQADA